jgi:hypothetical protein
VDFKEISHEHKVLLTLLDSDLSGFTKSFLESQFLIGLNVNNDLKKLLVVDNEHYKALAVFTSLPRLLDFDKTARPAIFSGKEIAEVALKSPSKLIEFDPPDRHRILIGSVLQSAVDGNRWIHPAQNVFLHDLVQEFLSNTSNISFKLELGDWTDVKIVLSGDRDQAQDIAPKLAVFLSQSPTAVQFMPSGADIIYSTVD